MARSGKSLVVKRDPWLDHGGKVPVGVIPAGARPAPGSRTRHPEPSAALDTLVSADGGFYGWADVRALLRLDEAGLEAAVTAKTVLCLRDGEGAAVFPSWQFTAAGAVLPFLSTILSALARGIDDPWTWALWLTSPDHGDDGASAVDLLVSGSDPRPILDDAAQDAAGWSQ